MPSYDDIVAEVLPDVEYHQNRYAREVARVADRGCRWLDLGAGERLHRGWIGPTAGELAGRARVLVGCDPDTAHLRRNRHLTHRVGVLGGALPFRDGAFDVVTANMVVEHLAEPECVLMELARVLDAGGAVVIVTPNARHPAVRLLASFVPRRMRTVAARIVERRAREHVFTTYYRANSVDALGRLAQRVGLRVRRIEPFWSYPMLRRPAWATRLEARWIRAQMRRGRSDRCSNLLVHLEKVEAERVPGDGTASTSEA